MAIPLQHRRGTTAEHSTFTGAVGELTVNTNLNELVVHDGVLVGGYRVAGVEAIDAQVALKSDIEEPVFTGAFVGIPSGTTATRPVTPTDGYLRYNTDLITFEGYKVATTSWGSVGGGQTIGNAEVKAINYNAQVINEDIVIDGSYNAFSVGDIAIEDGNIVTIENGGIWKVI